MSSPPSSSKSKSSLSASTDFADFLRPLLFAVLLAALGLAAFDLGVLTGAASACSVESSSAGAWDFTALTLRTLTAFFPSAAADASATGKVSSEGSVFFAARVLRTGLVFTSAAGDGVFKSSASALATTFLADLRRRVGFTGSAAATGLSSGTA